MRCDRLRQMGRSLAILASATAISGCTTMNGYVTNASGQSYYEQGNYAAAAGEFQQAVMADPDNPDYLANLARTRFRLGDAAGSEQLYRQALMKSPSHQPSYHGMSEVLMAQGRGNEAVSLLQTWVATQPYVAESHLEMAWLQREMGQHDAAAQSLQHALQVNPAHTTALAHLGQYYQEAGRPDQAVALYQQSLQTDWNQPEVHSRLAMAAQASGPGNPMAAMAMARGVHPYEMPRQQTVFGPPSQGAAMAQMQMQQMQMARMQVPGTSMSPAYAMAANRMVTPYAAVPAAAGQGMMAGMTGASAYPPGGMPMSMTTGSNAWNTASMTAQSSVTPPMVPPSLDIAPPNLGGGWQVVPGSLKIVDSGPMSGGTTSGATVATSQPVPSPQPDPTFSVSNVTQTVQSVSGSSDGLSAPAGSVPVLDAF